MNRRESVGGVDNFRSPDESELAFRQLFWANIFDTKCLFGVRLMEDMVQTRLEGRVLSQGRHQVHVLTV